MGNPLIRGTNDLATLMPELLIDWDYKENTRLPRDLMPGSNYQSHWICNKCGHKWVSRLDTRTKNGSGCPVCNTGGGSSTADYLLFILLKCFYGDDVSYRYSIHGAECDSYIHSRKICIEYDGIAFHNEDKDLVKRQWLEKQGITVLNIKERSDEQLSYQINEDEAFLPHMVQCTFQLYKDAYIDILKQWGILPEILDEFILKPFLDISKQEILSIIHKPPKSRSLEVALTLSETLVWDEKKNKLKPEDYYMSSNEYVYFKCKFGHSLYRQARHIQYGYNCPYCSFSKIEQGINSIDKSAYNLFIWFPYLRDKLSICIKHIKENYIDYTCPFCRQTRSVNAHRFVDNISPNVICDCLKDIKLVITILGVYDEHAYFTLSVGEVMYFVVDSIDNYYLKGYRQSICNLDVDLFQQYMGPPTIYGYKRNRITTVPINRKKVSSIKYLSSKESVLSSLKYLQYQRSLVEGTDLTFYVN